MSNKKKEPVVLEQANAPERKCNITPIAMAEYIKNYAPEDSAWFKKLCEENKKPNNTYGIDVKVVREVFITKYYKGQYDKKTQTKKSQFEDMLKSM